MSVKDVLNELDVLDARYKEDFHHVAKEHLRSYVESVTDAVPRFGTNAYICPCCKSGTGKNGKYTPAFFLFRKRDGELAFKCHACNVSGDIFTLAGLVNNASSFEEQSRIVAEFLGVDLARRTPLEDINVADYKVRRVHNHRHLANLRKEARNYIIESKKHVDETDYFKQRGLSPSIIERFNLGYDPEHGMAIIPFSMSYYVGRNTRIGADEKGLHKHHKPFGLRQPLYNLSALSSAVVFVTESPLDALSIIQVGGSAVALGGTSTSMFRKVLDIYKPESHFILACDNDEPGKVAQARLSVMLEERGLSFSTPQHPAFLSFKDANAILMADPTMLKEAVNQEINLVLQNRSLDALEKRSPFPKNDLDLVKQAAIVKAAAKNAIPKWNLGNSKPIREIGGR